MINYLKEKSLRGHWVYVTLCDSNIGCSLYAFQNVHVLDLKVTMLACERKHMSPEPSTSRYPTIIEGTYNISTYNID